MDDLEKYIEKRKFDTVFFSKCRESKFVILEVKLVL